MPMTIEELIAANYKPDYDADTLGFLEEESLDMTVQCKDIKYDVLELLLKNPKICQNEAWLLLQAIGYIGLGCKTKEDLVAAFEETLMYPLIKDLAERA